VVSATQGKEEKEKEEETCRMKKTFTSISDYLLLELSEMFFFSSAVLWVLVLLLSLKDYGSGSWVSFN
jgi:hypothetical protein